MNVRYKRRIYGLYDEKETLVFMGCDHEIAEFVGVSTNVVRQNVCRSNRNNRLNHKYRIEIIDKETITHKRCKICGKEKPVKDFKYYRYKGEKRPRGICRLCESEKYGGNK